MLSFMAIYNYSSPRKLRYMRLVRIFTALFLGVNPIDEAFLLELPDNRIIDHIIDGDFDCRICHACVCDEDFHSRARYIWNALQDSNGRCIVVFQYALLAVGKYLPMIFLACSLLVLKKCVASMSDITTFFTFSRFLAT